MTTIEHVTAVPQDGDEDGGFSRSVWTAVGVFAALLVAFWFFWPAGVVLGMAAGVLVTVRFGQHMHAAAQSVPTADARQFAQAHRGKYCIRGVLRHDEDFIPHPFHQSTRSGQRPMHQRQVPPHHLGGRGTAVRLRQGRVAGQIRNQYT